MRPIFEAEETKIFTFCIDIVMPIGCLCMVATYPSYPAQMPAIMTESFSLIGNGAPQMLSLRMRNITKERIAWTFNDPIATLSFIDTFPVVVENAT
jgi:hypothetical protein